MSDRPSARILFVDDNLAGSYPLVAVLRQEGFEVQEALTGAEALRLAQARPSLVILDVHLPDMSGFEVCRRLKTNPATASTLVLHLSGHYVRPEDKAGALDGGADGYLIKPVDPQELIAHVKALLRIRQVEAALHASEELLQHILENAPVVVTIKDVHGRYLLVNQRWELLFHRNRAQVVGRTSQDVFPRAVADALRANDREVFAACRSLEFEETVPLDDGLHTYLSVKFPLYDDGGAPYAVCGISTEITERKRAEELLLASQTELAFARRIQQKLFPTALPRLPGLDIGSATFGFDIGGASYPAEAIGGDYYDYLTLADGSLGVTIGDVSGHGMGPALLMAELRALLRAFAQTESDAGAILGLANRLLASDIEDDRFITLLLGRIDPEALTFRYASAGHTTGYVLDRAGAVKRPLPSTSIPLGIFPDAEFPAGEEIALGAGDMVLFVTDGVVEARAPDGAAFGTARTLDLVRACRCAPARQIVEDLYHAVRAYCQEQPQYDDITATVIKVTG